MIVDGKILVIRRSENEVSSAGYWEIPKGKVEFGEDPGTSLKREYMEEVGLNIELNQPWNISSHTYSRDGVDIHFWAIDYMVELADGESIKNIRLSKDHDKWLFVDKSELAALSPMYEDRKTTLSSLFS